jgi:serine/threonine-protein kinase
VVATAKGAVVTWADDHEQSGHDHAYTVLLDPSGHPTTRARDVTPEANNAARPTTLAVGERIVLLFWDRGGREPGVRVRWLDDEGVISSASKLVSSARTGNFWPVIEKAPEGFFVAWQDDRDKEGDDIFLRRLGSGLEPVGNEMRLTDYVPMQKQPVHARVPSMVVASNTLYVVYRLERDKARSILRLALPLSLPELSGVGLEDKALNVAQKDRRERTLRPAVVVNEDGAPADAPDIACGKDGCFVVWHGEKGGAYGALIEPLGGTVLWRKRFAPNGSRPAVASGSDGTVSVAYYEGGRLKLAGLSRQGVGIASVLGRVSGDQPRPVISTGLTKGEWYVAWQSQEANRTEAFVARAVCRP